MKLLKIAVCVLVFASATVSAAELIRSANPIEGQYIVVFNTLTDSYGASGVLRPAGDSAKESNRGVEILGQISERDADSPVVRAVMDAAVDLAVDYNLDVRQTYVHALQGIAVRASKADIERLLHDPRVNYVEEDAEFQLVATQNNATWGLDRIDQRNLPLNGSYVYNGDGSGVRAYVIDTGIRSSHNDFGGRVLPGATGVSDGRGTEDCNGHGTHVAGTIGGSRWGVAKDALLIPVRIFGCSGGASTSLIIAAVDWVRSNAIRPAVVNMSLGGGASSSMDSAVNNLINSGVTVVAAAGNSNANACFTSPARVSAAITVGSTTSSDSRSSFSNFGSCVNIFAPGSSIRSAWWTGNNASNTISGTSMAAPHVAGVAALWLESNPGASPSSIRNTIYNRATTGRLSGIGSGSPNRLLYSR